jgi:hypothetical protein
MENDIYDNIDDYVVEIEKELEVKKSTNYYLNPKNLMIEYNSCLEKNECSPKLIKYFENIARHFSRVYYYSSKNDLDACVNYAVSEAFRKWKKYNVKRSENIFSFFTTIIRNDLQTHYKYINKHKSEHISIESLFTNNQDK